MLELLLSSDESQLNKTGLVLVADIDDDVSEEESDEKPDERGESFF